MKELIYHGLGFPVLLQDINTIEFQGETLPDINHRQLEDLAFKTLLFSHAKISGGQMGFIRGYMKLSQKELAKLLGVKSHATISGWEGKLDGETGMPATTELVLRLLMADFIGDRDFPGKFKEFLVADKKPECLALKVA